MALSVNISSETDLLNLALAHLGQAPVDDIETADTGNAALTAGRQLFTIVRNIVLRTFRIPTGVKQAPLVLLFEQTDDEDLPFQTYRYTYLEPSDCVFFKKLANNQDRQETPKDRVKYEISGDQKDGTAPTITGISQATEGVVTCPAHGKTEGQLVTLTTIVGMTELNGMTVIVADPTTNTFKMRSRTTGDYIDTSLYGSWSSGGIATHISSKRILTDQEDALGEYVYYLTDLALWEWDVLMAWSYLLAFYLAPRVPGIDKDKIRGEMWGFWQEHLSDSASIAEDEQALDPPKRSKYLRRGRAADRPAHD